MSVSYFAASRKWVLVWGFTALWWFGVGLGTVSALSDGVQGPAGYPGWYPWAVLGLMWCIGAWLIAFSGCHPCTSVTVRRDGVIEGRVTFPFRVVRRRFEHHEVTPPQLIAQSCEDGEAFFLLRLPVQVVPGHDLVLAEGSREHCLAEQAAYLAALARQSEHAGINA